MVKIWITVKPFFFFKLPHKGRTIIFLEGGGGWKILKKNVCRAWKDKKIVSKHDMHKKMFAENADKLFKNISSKTEIKTKSNKFLLQILLTQDLQSGHYITLKQIINY